MTVMLVYTDLNGERVELTFGPNERGIAARHVLLLCKHQEKWLCTKHRRRGIEFPGGKAEEGESIEVAIKREVYEETGVTIHNVQQFAEYVVHTDEPFCKAVFTAEIAEIAEDYTLYETEGAVWLTTEALDHEEHISFYMKDEGMIALRKWVEQYASERKN